MSETTAIINTLSRPFVPILANFNYYAPLADGPGDPSPNDLELVLGTKDQVTKRLPVHDVRGKENSFNFKENGFRYVNRQSALKVGDFLDDEVITTTYYCEIEDILRENLPSITAIYHLGHIIRSVPKRTDFSPDADIPTDEAWNKPNRGAAPAPRVHIDFTKEGVHLVLIQAFGEEAANSITKRDTRYMAFSIWRPIKTIQRDPLGICNAESVKAGELVPLKRLYPDGKTGENVVVKAVEVEGQICEHEWYYISGQTPEGVLMIKIFDSEDDDWQQGGTVRVGPHCSFHLKGTDDEAVRESIEVRVVVSY